VGKGLGERYGREVRRVVAGGWRRGGVAAARGWGRGVLITFCGGEGIKKKINL